MKFKLNTERVLERDGIKFLIKTEGIDLTIFNTNPVMLDNHCKDDILGHWVNTEKVATDLISEPVFDNDDESVEAKDKVLNGSLKGVSMGICFDEVLLEGEVFIVTKSTLLEVSLVAIPENPEALIIPETTTVVEDVPSVEIPMEMGFVTLSKDGKEVLDFKDYVTNLVKPEVAETEVVEEVVIVEELPVEDVAKPIEDQVVIPVIDEVKEVVIPTELPQVAEVELKKVIVDNDTFKLRIIELTKSVEDLNGVVKLKDVELESLKTKVKQYELDKFNSFMNEAVLLGKITNESIEDFRDLTLDKAKVIIDKLPTKASISLSKTLNDNRNAEKPKDFGWYLNNDAKYLSKLAKEDFPKYKAMENAYYNK